MTPRQQALLLMNALEADSRLWNRLIATEESMEALLSANLTEEQRGALSPGACERIVSLIRSKWVKRQENRWHSMGIQVLYYGEKGYPPSLQTMENAPLVLFVRGRSRLEKPMLAVVGTRRSTFYGQQVARALGWVAAERGCILLSGGALGIDGAAHGGCLESGGETAVILAHGHNRIYPRQHKDLFSKIVGSGALITEYGLGVDAKPWHFPKRNRIIAGLADVIVVVEAPVRSGAIVTAQLALDLGKEIWAVPGRIDEKVCKGSNKLLFDGANPLIDVSDFAETLCSKQLDLWGSDVRKNRQNQLDITEKEQKILNLFQIHGDRTVDNLSAECKMTAADVISCISHLSALNLIYQSGPGRWRASIDPK